MDISTLIGGFLIIFAIMGLISLAITIALIIAQWKIFEKAGKPGWYSIIPIYNTYEYFELVGIKGINILWLLIPVIGWIVFFVFYVMFLFRLATAFGKDPAFGIGLLLLTPIFFMILGFDKNTVFVGYHGKNQQTNYPQNGQMPNGQPYTYPQNDTAMNQQFNGQQPIMGNPYVNHNQQPTQTVDPTVPHDNGIGNPY